MLTALQTAAALAPLIAAHVWIAALILRNKRDE